MTLGWIFCGHCAELLLNYESENGYEPNYFANLQSALAELYKDERDIWRIVAQAGINSARIGFNSSAINIWHSVLNEAEKNQKVEALLSVAEGEYGENQALGAACAAYRRSIQRSASSPNPPINYSQTTRARRPIPELLPYKLNRSEQKKQVRLAIELSRKDKGKPVVCLAYGDEKQCHHEFVNCLQLEWLPEFLGLPHEQNIITRYSLRLPKAQLPVFASGEALAAVNGQAEALRAAGQYKILVVEEIQIVQVMLGPTIGVLTQERHIDQTFARTTEGDRLVTQEITTRNVVYGLLNEDGRWKIQRVRNVQME